MASRRRGPPPPQKKKWRDVDTNVEQEVRFKTRDEEISVPFGSEFRVVRVGCATLRILPNPSCLLFNFITTSDNSNIFSAIF